MFIIDKIIEIKEITNNDIEYPECSKWLKNIEKIYNRMRKDSVNGIYESFCHFPLYVYPDVYSPSYFTDSYWFAKHLVKQIPDKATVLEIGTGTGIIAIKLGLDSSRKIIATDIVSTAVKNAKANVKRYKLEEIISVRKGDIFNPIKKDEKFDYIFWAHPFNNSPLPIDDSLLRTGFDYNYNSLREYITGARNHLKKNGKLLLGTGDSADLKTINEIASQNNYVMNLLINERIPLEYGRPLPIEYRIYEFVNNDFGDGKF
jgi:release factor glutamine methyltransferase